MEVNEKKLEEVLKRQRKEHQDYLDVVVEDFQSQVKFVVELVSGIKKQLIAFCEVVAKNTESIVNLQIQATALCEMVTKNTEHIEAMKTEVVTVRKNMEIMKEDISFIRVSMKTLAPFL